MAVVRVIALLLLVILAHDIRCGPTGIRLKYRPGIEKDFVSERAKVSLQCRSQDILVSLVFSEPFRGLVHAGKKDSGCSFKGDGKYNYTLSVPLTSCGTIQVPPHDSFSNTLTIRFHHALELEGDEQKTILCRYGTGSIQIG